MKRGDMALWILTKMAMLFFIFALSFFLLQVGGFHEQGVCTSQANIVTNGIASRISQVAFSPVEDERRVYSFESSISLGTGRARYEVGMLLRGEDDNKKFTINATPSSVQRKCTSGTSVVVGDVKIVFVPQAGAIQKWEHMDVKFFKPSARDPAEKSRYLVVIKCSSKYLDDNSQTRKFLFIQDCNEQDPHRCIDLATQGTAISRCCGWEGGCGL